MLLTPSGRFLAMPAATLDGLVHQLFRRHQVVEQADVVGLVGEHLPPAVQQFLGLAPAHQRRQAPGGVELPVVDGEEAETALVRSL